MRKTIATAAITLGIVFAAVPAIAVTPDPEAPSANAQCVGATNAICDQLFDWARFAQTLEATVTAQRDTIASQHAKIVKQRATIKRLRERLASAHR